MVRDSILVTHPKLMKALNSEESEMNQKRKPSTSQEYTAAVGGTIRGLGNGNTLFTSS